MADSNYNKQMQEVRDYIREMNAERRREEQRQKKAEKRAVRGRNRNTSGQKTPWIVKFDNAIHDFVGAPRNYDID